MQQRKRSTLIHLLSCFALGVCVYKAYFVSEEKQSGFILHSVKVKCAPKQTVLQRVGPGLIKVTVVSHSPKHNTSNTFS